MINLPSLKKLVKTSRVAWLFLLLAAFFLPFIFPLPATAAVQTSQQEFERAVTSEAYNKQSFDLQTFSGVVNAANVTIIGCVTPELQEQCQQQVGGSAVNTMGVMIAALYANPPASGVQYLADVSSRFGIVKPAYAQAGTGFQALSPILPIWRAFRNLAYLAFVIIFVVMGFAIMFRIKISPQAVITIQSALPRVVIALILVTFSYAIAGFLIDLIYVLIAIAIAALSPLISDVVEAQRVYLGANYATLIGAFLSPGGGLGAAWELARAMFSGATGATIGAILGALIGALIPVANIIALPAGGIIGGAVGAIGGVSILATLIFAVVLLFALFRLFFVLLMAYIQIILGVILGPIQILLDVVPGQRGFGSWFRNLLANIMIFPVAVVLLILGAVLSANVIRTEQAWSPPLLGVGNVEAVTALISFGILLITPQVATKVRDAISGPAFLPLGAAIGEAAGPPAAAMRGLVTRYRERGRVERELREKAKVLREHPELRV